MTDVSNPGDTPAPPTGDSGGQPQAPQPTPNGSEPDTNPGNSNGAMVPSDRLREETSKRREAEEHAAELQRQLDERNQQPQNPQSGEDDEVDPEVEKLITKTLEKKGYIKKEDLQAVEMKRQLDSDVQELTGKYAKTSVPFDAKEVVKYAKDHGLQLTNKQSLEAVYRDMNFEKIREAERNAAITEFQESGRNGGEKPRGGEGGEPEQQQEVHGIKNRVHAALQRSR